MSLHNEAKKEDIEKIVIMPGDPLRAKYIAENFLKDAKLVNSIRGMYAYTGMYKDKKVTVMAHGMGMASMGIYCYELYKFYDVDTIIRVGSCGAYKDELNLLDTLLVEKVYTESNFAYSYNNESVKKAYATSKINELIEQTAKENNIEYKKTNIFCTDGFDPYIADLQVLLNRLPKDITASEMESFALFYIAKMLNKNAACLLTVVDSLYDKKELTAMERQTSLNNMIRLALETIRKM